MRLRLRIPSLPKNTPVRLDLEEHVIRPLVVRADQLAPSSSPHLEGISSAATAMSAPPGPSASVAPTSQLGQAPFSSLVNKEQASSMASPTAGSYIGTESPISNRTQLLLIVGGAVALTIALFFIGFIFWRRRRNKRKVYLDKSNILLDKEPSVSAPLGNNWGSYTWNAETTFAPAGTYNKAVDLPEPAYVRPGTSQSNQSNRAMPTRAPFAPPNKLATPNPVPVYIPPPTTQVPAQRQPPAASRGEPPESPMHRSDKVPASPGLSSTLPSYLAKTNEIPETPKHPPQKVSHFSWTNSQTPKTPVDPNRDVNADRYSGVSEAESVARYRTVESWVGVQAGRYEERRIQERIQLQLDEALGELDNAMSRKSMGRGGADRMKTIPLKDSSSVFVDGVDEEEADQVTELSLIPDSARKASVKRTASRKAKHRTNESDMTVFRAHPGTKVEIPDARYIPSEILDGRFPPNTFPDRESYGR